MVAVSRVTEMHDGMGEKNWFANKLRVREIGARNTAPDLREIIQSSRMLRNKDKGREARREARREDRE